MQLRIRIGLTGSVGSGKSSVRHWLGERGADLLDLDHVAHAVLAEPQMLRRLVETFGDTVLDSQGQVDRAFLASLVFDEPAALAQLEALVHPEIRRAALAWLRGSAAPLVVMEAVKLVEGGLAAHLDQTWLICTSKAERRKRLAARSWTADQIERRIVAAPPMLAQLAVADRVIDNSGPWSRTEAQLERAWRREIAPRLAPGRPG